MSWKAQFDKDPIHWLTDGDTPGIDYLAYRDVLELPPDDPRLVTAREVAYSQGPIAAILANMHEEGYWEEPGPGYRPKYQGTVWSLITLAQLGASLDADERIRRGVDYILEHALTPGGQFSIEGTPSTTIDCLQGNLCATLVDLGCEDERLDLAYEWMARTVTGEGLAPLEEKSASLRYYAGKCGPNFQCGANNKLPCAWGAAKVMLAFSKLSEEQRTPLIERAIQQGIEFLFSVDPAGAGYPSGWSDKPSGNWWKFGFPVFYITDILQIAEALVALGYGRDPRLAKTLALIVDKGDDQGRWSMEYSYTGKIWVDFGAKKKPNKWVTLRAVRVLEQVER